MRCLDDRRKRVVRSVASSVCNFIRHLFITLRYWLYERYCCYLGRWRLHRATVIAAIGICRWLWTFLSLWTELCPRTRYPQHRKLLRAWSYVHELAYIVQLLSFLDILFVFKLITPFDCFYITARLICYTVILPRCLKFDLHYDFTDFYILQLTCYSWHSRITCSLH